MYEEDEFSVTNARRLAEASHHPSVWDPDVLTDADLERMALDEAEPAVVVPVVATYLAALERVVNAVLRAPQTAVVEPVATAMGKLHAITNPAPRPLPHVRPVDKDDPRCLVCGDRLPAAWPGITKVRCECGAFTDLGGLV